MIMRPLAQEMQPEHQATSEAGQAVLDLRRKLAMQALDMNMVVKGQFQHQ